MLQAFAAQGTPLDMVSIGNEIRNGILWPTGQLTTWSDAEWNALGTLLKAGVAGARAGNPRGHKLRVMLHYDNGGDNGGSRAFFDHIKAEGVPYDVIGLSYYSFWHGHLRDLRANVNDLATRFGKDVMVAEIQYAWTLGYGDSTNNFVWDQSQLEPGYPASPDGQLSLVNDVLSILADVPGGHGDGLFYWEPEWVPGVGWEPGAGRRTTTSRCSTSAGPRCRRSGSSRIPAYIQEGERQPPAGSLRRGRALDLGAVHRGA